MSNTQELLNTIEKIEVKLNILERSKPSNTLAIAVYKAAIAKRIDQLTELGYFNLD